MDKHVKFLFLPQKTCNVWNFLRETCTLTFLFVKPNLFVDLFACWFLLMKLNLSWYFFSWNLSYIDLLFHEIELIMILFFINKAACWFFSLWNWFNSWNLFRADLLCENFIYLDIFLLGICCVMILFFFKLYLSSYFSLWHWLHISYFSFVIKDARWLWLLKLV